MLIVIKTKEFLYRVEYIPYWLCRQNFSKREKLSFDFEILDQTSFHVIYFEGKDFEWGGIV